MKRITIFLLILASITFILNVPSFSSEQETDPVKLYRRAIINGDINGVRSLIKSGLDINVKNKNNVTPLHMAINHRRNDIALLLIENNADITTTNDRGETPLHFAAKTGQKNIVELLIEKEANVNAIDARSNTPLSLAQKGGYREIAELLTQKGATRSGREEAASPETNRTEQKLEETEGQFQRRGNTVREEEEEPEIDILADPNEIRERIKTYEGLDKTINEVSSKSRIGTRHWQKISEDNRVSLVRVFNKQIDKEVELIHKTSLEEKAVKTAKAVETFMTKKKERTSRILKELTAQLREDRQTRTEERGRSRSSSRSTRGTGSQGRRGSGRNGTRGTQPPEEQANIEPRDEQEEQEQLDERTQYELDLWLRADTQNYDNKLELANAVQEQTYADYNAIRKISEQEDAKKTIATIDGLLLERRQRLNKLAQYIEEQKQKEQEEPQDQPGRNRATRENTGRRGGRTGRGRSGGTRGGRR